MSGKNPEDPMLAPKQVAELLGVERNSVYRWIKNKSLPAHKIGGVWRVYRVDLPQPKGAR